MKIASAMLFATANAEEMHQETMNVAPDAETMTEQAPEDWETKGKRLMEMAGHMADILELGSDPDSKMLEGFVIKGENQEKLRGFFSKTITERRHARRTMIMEQHGRRLKEEGKDLFEDCPKEGKTVCAITRRGERNLMEYPHQCLAEKAGDWNYEMGACPPADENEEKNREMFRRLKGFTGKLGSELEIFGREADALEQYFRYNRRTQEIVTEKNAIMESLKGLGEARLRRRMAMKENKETI